MNQLITQHPGMKLKYLIMALLILLGGALQAQQENITGKISDSAGKPLANVSVLVKNATNGTRTDANGNYSLNVNSSLDVLVFQHVGFSTKEIALDGRTIINVVLEAENESLEEVVVVGYGAVRKSDLTGSVSSIKAEDLTAGTNINVQQALQGRVPGVQIYQKSGEPGAAMSVQIRGITSITGNNAPLYVIDGMPVNDASAIGSASPTGAANNPNNRSPLSSINPADIASIEILKDASATAIYGSRGANGVVLITTKQGSAGKINVNYNATYGKQTVANTQRFMTGDEYTTVINQIIMDGNLSGDPGSYPPVTGANYNTDWQSLLLKDAPIQSHDLSFNGGEGNTKYYISAGYFDQEGIMLNSGTTRYNARVNLETSVTSKYSVGINLTTAYSRDKYNANGLGLNDNASALYMAQNYDPTSPALSADGSVYRSPLMSPMDNPLAVIDGQYSVGDTYRTFGNIYAEYFFIPSLSAKVKVGADLNDSKRSFWIDPSTLIGAGYGGYADVRNGKRGYYLMEGTVNYNKDLGIHRINAVAGATYERYTSSTLVANGRGYSLPDLTYYAIGSGNPTLNGISSGVQENILLSYLGRVNYSLLDKYLFTFSFRADGSARFGPENRFGYFPSAALGWKLKQEDFLKDVNFISDLKLRASYGAIGNQPNTNYLYFSTYSGGRNVIFDGQRISTIAPTRSPNPFLQWESAQQVDIGLDFGFLNSRITGSIDYYNRRTSNLLYNNPQPLSTGFGTRTENIGSMRNSGVEFSINGVIVDGSDFKFDANFNITTLKNRILSLISDSEVIGGGPGNIGEYNILKPGISMGSFYGYVIDGVWQAGDDFSTAQPGVRPGDLKYRDFDNNNIINTEDRIVLGNSLPDFFYGFNTNFSYKNLSLAIFVEGSQGAMMLNSSLADSYYPVDFRRNKLAELYLNRWTPDNPSNEYPSFIPGDVQGSRQINNKTVEDASYLRLQSVRLGYKIPLPKNKFISNATVFVTGQNLYTLTNYSGVDPAANAIGSDILRVDYNSYPLTRTFTGGINVQF
ncbi:TonB-dependent receptor [Sphingobacterium sp. DN00404]|uniref:TonB-dependent receptor n=1 Tax=Sphingobacterium micropteri TaxID=2763501 RepID=A0ABR7YPN8_9SPHI|nr:TonB-dependent receptor [Sphingobacterium micropteri]MBD1433267.1 TonB-dependent receptor [Sphingobacterium micropteri]